MILAPLFLAPLAKACEISVGLAWPSVGKKAAPCTSSISIIGHSSCASLGESNSICNPKECAVVVCLRTSCQRSLLQARRSPPFIFQPVLSPVSSSIRLYKSTE